MPNTHILRSQHITGTIATLQARMDAAARALDFDDAKRFRP